MKSKGKKVVGIKGFGERETTHKLVVALERMRG